MPGKRAKGERLLEDALAALARALDEANVPWMIIGGIAVIAHGVRRFTTDIDAAVLGDAMSVDQILETLARHDIAPRIPDAAAFARDNLVLLVRHVPTGVDLDVSQAWSSFEHEALAAREKAQFGRIRAPMSVPDDLIVFKAIAGRPKDIEDAETLLILHPHIDIRRARRRVAELAELADAPELVDSFDAITARVAREAAKGGSSLDIGPTKPRPRRRRS